MVARIAQCTLDVVDVRRMADFWSQVLGCRVDPNEGDSVHLVPNNGDGLRMWLQPTAHTTQDKLRCHIDLEADDPAAEVARVIALGARRADVGQTGHESFEVLVDPEGNEFCILGVRH